MQRWELASCVVRAVPDHDMIEDFARSAVQHGAVAVVRQHSGLQVELAKREHFGEPEEQRRKQQAMQRPRGEPWRT